MPILRQPPEGSTCCVCVQSKLFKPRLCIFDNDIIMVGTIYVPIGHRLVYCHATNYKSRYWKYVLVVRLSVLFMFSSKSVGQSFGSSVVLGVILPVYGKEQCNAVIIFSSANNEFLKSVVLRRERMD